MKRVARTPCFQISRRRTDIMKKKRKKQQKTQTVSKVDPVQIIARPKPNHWTLSSVENILQVFGKIMDKLKWMKTLILNVCSNCNVSGSCWACSVRSKQPGPGATSRARLKSDSAWHFRFSHTWVVSLPTSGELLSAGFCWAEGIVLCHCRGHMRPRSSWVMTRAIPASTPHKRPPDSYPQPTLTRRHSPTDSANNLIPESSQSQTWVKTVTVSFKF